MLVGRAAELARLGAAVRAGRCAAVVGEAGAGKTRLVREVVAESGRPAFVGGALASLTWTPYLALARAVRRMPPTGDAAAVAAFVAGEVGEGFVVLEDLQWADPDTLAVVPALAERVPVVATVRSDDDRADVALTAARGRSWETIVLAGLDDAAANELAAALGIPLEARADAVARAGGNPLFLEEVAHAGDTTGRLDELVLRHFARCSAAARTAAAFLALGGRPLRAELLGTGGDELVAAALAVVDGGWVRLRHARLGEVAAAGLAGDTRREVHRRLAAIVADAGEAARHLEAAGDCEVAYVKAMEAARATSLVSVRAGHLAVAARCAPADDVAGVTARAIDDLLLADQVDAALALLDHVELPVAVVAKVHRYAGDTSAVEAVAGAVPEEAAYLAAWARWAPGAAQSLPTPGPDLDAHARAAAAEAAMEAAWGDPELARSKVTDAMQNVASVGARHWTRQFELLAAVLDLHREGRPEAVATTIHGVLAASPLRRNRALAVAHLAVALVDGGRVGDAAAALDAEPSPDPRSAESVVLSWARAEVELAAGRPRRAATAGDAGATAPLHGFPGRALSALARLWAGIEQRTLAQRNGAIDDALRDGPDAARLEAEGVRLLADPSTAADARAALEQAAAAWAGRHRRGELRCAWAAGEAARLAGDQAGAREALLAVEAVCDDEGWRPLLARARRSLRRAGVHRASARQDDELGLTRRERQVLDLVGEGVTTAEIAARLGVARSTVDTQVESAMVKLGARTRLQAAAMVRNG